MQYILKLATKIKDLMQINILFTWQGIEISQTQTCCER